MSGTGPPSRIVCERCGKVAYRTVKQAEEAAKQIRVMGGPDLYAYWSDSCSKYHLSTVTR